MAMETRILDDVHMALERGKKVDVPEGSEKRKLDIPRKFSSTGKRRALSLDVSPTGNELLDEELLKRDQAIEEAEKRYKEGIVQLKEAREADIVKAWDRLNMLGDRVQRSRGTTPGLSAAEQRKKEAAQATEAHETVQEDTHEQHQEPEQHHEQHQEQGYQQPQHQWGNGWQ